MKKIEVVCALLAFLSAFSNVYAHPPYDIKITFDPSTKMLTAVIEHNTKNILNHYIKTVDVELNGSKVLSHTISRQDNHNNQRVVYLIPDVKKGDVLSVEGTCSIHGKLKKFVHVN